MDERRAIYEMKLTPGMGFLLGPEGLKAHQEALRVSKEKSHRVIINIVGEERQGKTSLRRLLAREPFNPNEESTVGIDHELVDTKGLTERWSAVDLRFSNLSEFDLILGKHIHRQIMKQRRSVYLAPVMCFVKIAFINVFMLHLYWLGVSAKSLHGHPWFFLHLYLTFILSRLAFGSKDGFGIAIGIYILILLCDGINRWNLHLTFQVVGANSSFTVALVAGFLFFAFIQMFNALCCGLSFGMGMAFVLCVMQPPSASSPQHPLANVHVYLFTLSTLVGIGTAKYENVMFYIVGPAMAVLVKLLPEDYSFTLIFGLGCGHSHGVFLPVGQTLYIMVNDFLKRIFPSRNYRRFLSYFLGIWPGIIFAKSFGWTMPERIQLSVLSGLGFLAGIEMFHKILDKEKGSKALKNPSSVIGSNRQGTTLKFVVRDFAGHPLYHHTHHIYMSGQCVYIVVFNLVEAGRDHSSSLEAIQYWLQAIYMHARYPSVRVLIVGTHRNSALLSEAVIRKIGMQLKDALPRMFYNMLVWNPDDGSPMFAVENSLRLESDRDHQALLRNTLVAVCRGTLSQYHPIRHYAFYPVVEHYRERKKLVEKKSLVLEECRQTADLAGLTPHEFEEVLQFFSQTGEILYNVSSPVLRDLVVFDPKCLVDIMSKIVCPCAPSTRESRYAEAWSRLEETGLCSHALLQHILSTRCRYACNNMGSDSVVKLLENYNLVCKMDFSCDGYEDTNRCYLVPAMLPRSPVFPQNYWEDSPSDLVVHVDFGTVCPLAIFLRLICQCTTSDQVVHYLNGKITLNICRSKAFFTYKETQNYKLELLKSDSPTCSQQLMKMVIRGGDRASNLLLATVLSRRLFSIIRQDFQKCHFHIGILCPWDSPHDFRNENELHILSLVNPSDVNISLPSTKDFWCGGRKILVENGMAKTVPENGGNNLASKTNPSDNKVSLDTNILDLCETMYSYICNSLNITNPLGQDWMGLAGKLGKSHRCLQLLTLKSPTNPCDALFHHWSTTDPNATLGSLLDHLCELERIDIVTYIREHVS